MRNSIVLKTILIVSGLIAFAIGATILLAPDLFYASYGVALDGNVNLTNEIRASGGGLFAIGVLVISGAFVPGLAFTATLVAVLLYLSYGLSRLVSIVLDGLPQSGLLQAAGLELVIGLACTYAFLRYRKPPTSVET